MGECRFLQFVNWRTGERAENPGKVEVTGKTGKEIDQIERGMLRNCNIEGGWGVDDFTEENPHA